jgi:hypothetical protein
MNEWHPNGEVSIQARSVKGEPTVMDSTRERWTRAPGGELPGQLAGWSGRVYDRTGSGVESD